jgi:two-component system NtrC family response regulator
MADILIIDDEKEVCQMLAELIRGLNHTAVYAHTLHEGMSRVDVHSFDVVFLDVQLPDGNGLDILPHIRSGANAPEVIIMTGAGDPDGAQLAIENGAWDYLQKPLSSTKITLPMNRVLQYRENLKAAKQLPTTLKLDGFLGKSPKVKKCLDLLAQAAVTNANVLITGETGTGKELFARALHDNSKRAEQNFVVVDCAALPETLIESSLFGHEKGAFTGAEKASSGLVAQADHGTLFLDEIGELSPSIQKSFLRVLQEHRYRPVGGKSEKKSDFRLVSATNKDLEKMIEDGFFREDLLYRLRTFTIHLPPLRDRQEDIRELIVYQTNRICQNQNIQPKGFAPDFFDTLSAYHWPGNIRQLFHTLEVAITSSLYEPILFANHIPNNIRAQVARLSVTTTLVDGLSRPQTEKIDPADIYDFRQYRASGIADIEREYCQKLMKQTKGNIVSACKLSGLGRSRLYSLLKKHHVSRLGWDI